MRNRNYKYSDLPDVYVSGIDVAALSTEEQDILYQQAKYCHAMIDADTQAMGRLVSEDKTYTHMSGMQQTREQYFSDVKKDALNYHRIGIENPEVCVDGNRAALTYTAALTANAYGARGTFHMKGTHFYEKRNNGWVEVNG